MCVKVMKKDLIIINKDILLTMKGILLGLFKQTRKTHNPKIRDPYTKKPFTSYVFKLESIISVTELLALSVAYVPA